MADAKSGHPDIPFAEIHELNKELSEILTSKTPDCLDNVILPGNPRPGLLSSAESLTEYLVGEFVTPILDRIASRLWLITTQSSASISPLHHQSVRGRKVFLTEDPGLHLVWIDDQIFIKPIPAFLLSYAFWKSYLVSSASQARGLSSDYHHQLIRPAILGFLRTYSHLIKHPSDLRIAQEHGLIPSTVTYDSFCRFSLNLLNIPDSVTSPRYGFGEIRLSRLNLWAKVLIGRWNYLTIPRQYDAYFQRFVTPLLFFFGSLSVVLGALQLELAVEATTNAPWKVMNGISRYISVVSILTIGLIVTVLILLFVGKLLIEWQYAVKDKVRQGAAKTKSKV